jgi:hypothetical protein
MPDTKTDQRRFPVSLAISIGCGLITAVWLYLQLRVWQEEGHDHMLTAANIFITIFLWVLLSFSIYKNRKDARRAEYLEAEIVALKDDHKLQVEDLNRKLLFRPPILPWGGYKSEADQRASVDEQNRLINLGRSVDSLLSPLQVDTLRLSKELLRFLADMGSRPEVSAEMLLYDSRGNRKNDSIVIQDHMAATNQVLLPWIAKSRSNFKTDLLPQLEDISLRYGKIGIGVDLVPHKEEYLLDYRWFFDVSLELVKLAHGIDTMKVVPILGR